MGCSRIPSQKGPKLLARAEYGYQFNPYSYRAPFAAAAQALRVKVVTAEITDVECRRGRDFRAAPCRWPGDRSRSVRRLHRARCAVAVTPGCRSPRLGRRLRAALTQRPVERIGPPCRNVIARGNSAGSPRLRCKASVARLTVYAPETESEALARMASHHNTPAKSRSAAAHSAWMGNCVAIGHAAEVLEPLTPRTDAVAANGKSSGC